MNFSAKLKQLRESAGLSQEKLASELGVARKTINSYENANSFPQAAALSKIAGYFGVSIENLISESDEFLEKARQEGGARGKREAQKLIADAAGLFAGGRISEDEKEAVMRALQEAYWISRENAKRKYTPRKLK